jgi:hypothetical protein
MPVNAAVIYCNKKRLWLILFAYIALPLSIVPSSSNNGFKINGVVVLYEEMKEIQMLFVRIKLKLRHLNIKLFQTTY